MKVIFLSLSLSFLISIITNAEDPLLDEINTLLSTTTRENLVQLKNIKSGIDEFHREKATIEIDHLKKVDSWSLTCKTFSYIEKSKKIVPMIFKSSFDISISNCDSPEKFLIPEWDNWITTYVNHNFKVNFNYPVDICNAVSMKYPQNKFSIAIGSLIKYQDAQLVGWKPVIHIHLDPKLVPFSDAVISHEPSVKAMQDIGGHYLSLNRMEDGNYMGEFLLKEVSSQKDFDTRYASISHNYGGYCELISKF